MSRTEDQYRIKKATRQGSQAFFAGKALSANPWRGGETRAAWERGWAWARDLPEEGGYHYDPDAQPWGSLQ